MHIKRVKEEIKSAISAYLKKDEYGTYLIPAIRQRPLLIMGPPGIGKTQIMEQIARECKIALVAYTITHHTRQSAVGLPFIRQKEYGGRSYSVTEYTMSEIIASVYEKMEQTGLKEGILFIDEINCVSETLAPTMLQFLQCKTFGNQQVPEGWIIVAAGNPPEYNKSVRDFDVVTLDRIRMMEVEENYDVWKEYAYRTGIHPAIISYLELKRDNFYRIETTVDGKAFATARGWEDLSEFLKVCELLEKEVDREVVYQYIRHWKIAKDFANYVELYRKYRKDYGLEQILEGCWSKDTIEKLGYAPFDERLSVLGMLLGKLNELFREYCFQDRRVSILHGYLKDYMETGDMDETLQRAFEEYERLRRAEQLTKVEDQIWRRVVEMIESYKTNISVEHLEGEAAKEVIRKNFQEETQARTQSAREAGKSLDHAFNFLEAAFGDSQEMVSFVTELNTGFYSIQYLRDHDCNKYYVIFCNYICHMSINR